MRKLIISEEEQKHIKNLYNINEIDAEKVVAGLFQMAQDYATGKRGGMETTSDDTDEKTDYEEDIKSSTGDDFIDITKKIIEKFEGGYWNPTCAQFKETKHPSQSGAYVSSSETMYGLDRYAGNIESKPSGKRFFELIDEEKEKMGAIQIGKDWTNMDNFCRKWKWNYKPNEPLKSELLELAAKHMKTLYDDNASRYFKGKTKSVVESSKPLILHFSYATWNGPVAFKQFAESMNKAVEEGLPIKKLVNIAKDDRKNKYRNTHWEDATEKVVAAIDSEAASEGIS